MKNKIVATSKTIKVIDDKFYYFGEEFEPRVTWIIDEGFPTAKQLKIWLAKNSYEEGQRVLEEAGDRGSKVHAAAQDIICGKKVKLSDKYHSELTGKAEPLTFEEWEHLQAFERFINDYKPEFLMVEQAVRVKGVFAGTLDILCKLRVDIKIKVDEETGKQSIRVSYNADAKPVIVLLDLKTSSGIRPQYQLQTGAYAFGVANSSEFNSQGQLHIAYTGVIRTGTQHIAGYELKLFPDWSEDYKMFLHCLEMFKFLNPNAKPHIKEYPKFIKLPKELIFNPVIVKLPTPKKGRQKKQKQQDVKGTVKQVKEEGTTSVS